MKLYMNVIARCLHRGSRLPQEAYAYSHAPVPRNLHYLCVMTWSSRWLAMHIDRGVEGGKTSEDSEREGFE